jgi:hypothetical protein
MPASFVLGVGLDRGWDERLTGAPWKEIVAGIVGIGIGRIGIAGAESAESESPESPESDSTAKNSTDSRFQKSLPSSRVRTGRVTVSRALHSDQRFIHALSHTPGGRGQVATNPPRVFCSGFEIAREVPCPGDLNSAGFERFSTSANLSASHPRPCAEDLCSRGAGILHCPAEAANRDPRDALRLPEDDTLG